jgi:hypothetical protein
VSAAKVAVALSFSDGLNPAGVPTLGPVSPTIFRDGGFRFYFFSREESRLHVHVQCTNGEAKFWLEPVVHLAQNHGLNARQLRTTRRLIEEHVDDIRRAWARHFPG